MDPIHIACDPIQNCMGSHAASPDKPYSYELTLFGHYDTRGCIPPRCYSSQSTWHSLHIITRIMTCDPIQNCMGSYVLTGTFQLACRCGSRRYKWLGYPSLSVWHRNSRAVCFALRRMLVPILRNSSTPRERRVTPSRSWKNPGLINCAYPKPG